MGWATYGEWCCQLAVYSLDVCSLVEAIGVVVSGSHYHHYSLDVCSLLKAVWVMVPGSHYHHYSLDVCSLAEAVGVMVSGSHYHHYSLNVCSLAEAVGVVAVTTSVQKEHTAWWNSSGSASGGRSPNCHRGQLFGSSCGPSSYRSASRSSR